MILIYLIKISFSFWYQDIKALVSINDAKNNRIPKVNVPEQSSQSISIFLKECSTDSPIYWPMSLTHSALLRLMRSLPMSAIIVLWQHQSNKSNLKQIFFSLLNDSCFHWPNAWSTVKSSSQNTWPSDIFLTICLFRKCCTVLWKLKTRSTAQVPLPFLEVFWQIYDKIF